eukprot:Sspe_Gene.116491::Locus_105773_Transcript_1_1_Confidence_1.000_Length_415::g.116491::m.116491
MGCGVSRAGVLPESVGYSKKDVLWLSSSGTETIPLLEGVAEAAEEIHAFAVEFFGSAIGRKRELKGYENHPAGKRQILPITVDTPIPGAAAWFSTLLEQAKVVYYEAVRSSEVPPPNRFDSFGASV